MPTTNIKVPYAISGAAQRRPAPAQQRPQPRQAVPVKKRRRKERSYFFIMRRGVCFVMMLLALVWVAVILLNYLNVMPQYTSFMVVRDLTPMDERVATDSMKPALDDEGNPVLDEDGEPVMVQETDDDGNVVTIPYEEKTKYVSLMDPIYGAISYITKKPMVDDEGNSLSPYYDLIEANIYGAEEEAAPAEEEAAEEEGEGVAEAAEDGEEGEGETEGETETEETTPVDNAAAKTADTMFPIAKIAFTYFPVALVVAAVFALLIIILAFLSLFGRRIFRGFFIFAIVMVLAAVIMLVGVVAMSGSYAGAPKYAEDGTIVSILDFSKVGEVLTGSFSEPPASALDPEVDIIPLQFVSGIGALALVALPLLILILSFFTKKRVPYSIFDR
jgi:hypothetical protein